VNEEAVAGHELAAVFSFHQPDHTPPIKPVQGMYKILPVESDEQAFDRLTRVTQPVWLDVFAQDSPSVFHRA
jgi:hypothetical protein